jgi:hypothetical protein
MLGDRWKESWVVGGKKVEEAGEEKVEVTRYLSIERSTNRPAIKVPRMFSALGRDFCAISSLLPTILRA